MKKILCIVQLPPPIHGVTLTNDIIRNSKDFNSKFKTKYIDYSFVKAINKIGGFSIQKGFFFIWVLFKILFQTFKFKPDAIYFTIAPVGGAFLRDAILVSFLKLLHKKKIVLHLHGKGIYAKMRNSRVRSYLYNSVFFNTDVILLSSLLKDDIKLVKKKHRIYYLANGIKQIPIEINKKETNDKSYKILYLSNLISSKGVLVLLEALHKVIGKGYDNFTVNFVGKTSKSITEEIFNKEIKRLKLQKKIKYLGAKYGEEKNEILDNSEIFVFPTLKDCFPLVLLEAMQSKLAIISTNEGAIPEIIENNVNGIICNKGDVEALCNAIIRLFEFPNLINEYGRNAQEKYKKHYTVKMFETNLIDCFNKIFAK